MNIRVYFISVFIFKTSGKYYSRVSYRSGSEVKTAGQESKCENVGMLAKEGDSHDSVSRDKWFYDEAL
ncbi:hypothetical protein W03_06370 [Nitrosomonas sp. PY1]|nr:hypothetical protein W03_06370 [Nitrosomonas sp. PY1]